MTPQTLFLSKLERLCSSRREYDVSLEEMLQIFCDKNNLALIRTKNGWRIRANGDV